MREADPALVATLERAELVRRDGDALQVTRRWQGAMMRAAARLQAIGDESDDLRVPVVSALLEVLGDGVGDEELAGMAAVMARIEAGRMLAMVR